MNILPHKSWHVRTKRNIARVRKDEAKAADEEKERQRKISLAGQEARTSVLRQRASERLSTVSASTSLDNSDLAIPLAPVNDIIQTDGHVNLFQDLEEGGKKQGGVNEEAAQENKKEQDDYEKKIGYLVYLGQDSLESSKQRPWYAKIDRGGAGEIAKERLEEVKKFEKSGYLSGLTRECNLTTDELKLAKFKNFQDPLQDIRKYLKTPGVAQKLGEKSTPTKRKHSPEPTKSHKKPKKSKSKKSKHKKKKHAKKESSEEEESSGPETDEEEQRKKNALEKLRSERLQREREERRRTEQLLAKLRGEKPPEDLKEEEEKASGSNSSSYKPKNQERDGVGRSGVKQKYNSQFNPELARQNYDYS